MQEPDFSQTCRFREKLKKHQFLHCKAIPAKTLDTIFLKTGKNVDFG